MTFKLDGLDDLKKTLDKLADNARSLDGEHQVPMNEVLTDEFMRTHTAFDNFVDFVTASNLLRGELDSDAFAAIPDEPWDDWVRKETSFENWEEMMSQATTDWAGHRLFDGVE